MNSQVVDTSLEAYLQIKPVLGKKRRQVYELLRDASWNGFDMTDKEMCKALGWEINCVTPRRNELVKQGVVVLSQKRLCGVTGNRARAWKTTVLIDRIKDHPNCRCVLKCAVLDLLEPKKEPDKK